MTYHNICVFCGAKDAVDEKYKKLAADFATAMGQQKRHLIYGGGGSGLMGVVSHYGKKHGAKVTGIYPKIIEQVEVQDYELDEVIYVDNLFIRKEMMLEKSDAFVILPGGFGTLDELFEVITLKNLRIDNVRQKPVFILNEFNYWQPLEALCEKVIEEKFASPDFRSNYQFIKTLDELIGLL